MTVPEGWKVRKLGDILDVQNGFAFDSELFSKDAGTPLIRIRDLKGGNGTEVRFAGEYDSRFVVHAGDLLIGMDGEFCCYEWTGQDALLNQRVCRLIGFSDELEPAFVKWGINPHLKAIEDRTPFVTVKHLSSKAIKHIEFAYPAREEQSRIVARIKECMDRVDEIEQLRSESLAEAEAVLPSVLHGVFEAQAGKSETKSIGELAIETRYGTSNKCHTNPEGVPILRIPNVAAGMVNFENLKYCDLPADERRRLLLEDGDLLFVRTNGSRDLVGRCAIFTRPDDQAAFAYASYLIRVRLNRSRVMPKYLAFFLNSTKGREELGKRRRTSAGQFNINSENLRTIPVPIPSIDEQARILAQLEEREQFAVKLTGTLQEARNEEQFLRESILRKAFAGEL
jgi:type I restriction enzyme S subunit